MALTPFVVQRLLDPDQLQRKVLLAVELFDPIAQSLVSRSVAVKARGLTGEPILSWGGRFVWVEEHDTWPEAISVKPYRLPFEPQEVAPPRPPNFPIATAEERRVRIVLRPTPAYAFDGVTAIRGQLREGSSPSSPAVKDARVQLKWHDLNSGAWLPSSPASALDLLTDKNGQFAAFLRVARQSDEEPDAQNGMLKVRLQFTRGDFITETRVTSDDFPFVSDPNRKGRVAEGQLLARDLTLGWADLLPI